MTATVETNAINRAEKRRISHLQFNNLYQIAASPNLPLWQIRQNQNRCGNLVTPSLAPSRTNCDRFGSLADISQCNRDVCFTSPKEALSLVSQAPVGKLRWRALDQFLAESAWWPIADPAS